MSPSLSLAISATRETLRAKYQGWDHLEPAERRLLVMAYLADVLKVREVGGNNRGKWVAIFQEAAGLDPQDADPWCAAALTFASLVADAPRPKRPADNPAAVLGWLQWAKDAGKMAESPQRGDICMRRTSATTGHIGVVVRAWGLWVLSIEGNTSSGEEGSQADGGGLYRRIRLRSFWSWGFARV